ncbi:hypothetical protein [Leadbettera azotonutricia]|uniref:Uncharacterized protein n=1 Tax=Leadbettera azotonutricia (strain ATCC BAA-888 / DSM 13862 / ZAS-9) TaxID=545695 RepID=F5YGE6_LEAAZ|nr:hypothetical protein [Leadbettera azotonutricia]AEF82037.1 hypothetical protein TREAZ_2373 [Leadbettera azotonutricia ZAS-9]
MTNPMNEITLEEALKPFWEEQDRFYETNKHLTMRQLLESMEGRKYNFTDADITTYAPVVFHDLSKTF